MLKNKKAFMGQLLIFIALAAITAGFVFIVYRGGNEIAADAFFIDDKSTVSTIAEAVVNSPSCLLHTESITQGTETYLVAHRGTINWNSRALTQTEPCVKKGTYQWNAVVKNISDSQTKTITGYDTSLCTELGSRAIPVIIRNGNTFNSGEVNVSVAATCRTPSAGGAGDIIRPIGVIL